MIKKTLLIILPLISSVLLFAQQYGSFKDARDGKVYKTVKIGNQIWMAENVNVDRFRNGDPISQVKTDEAWKRAKENKEPAWCYYKNDPSNGLKYGKLYNWFAVNDPRGIAAVGWHVPSQKEWQTLISYLGGEEQASTKLKSKESWVVNTNNTNSSGFSALSGGFRFIFGQFSYLGEIGYWWSSTAHDPDLAVNFDMSYKENSIEGHGTNKLNGYSLRFIKD
jgi:uncharacterized protein (TIGR02145 family)